MIAPEASSVAAALDRAMLILMLAVIAATSNVVGGFLITDRMLKMFKKSGPTKS